jgi:hypothetical protein
VSHDLMLFVLVFLVLLPVEALTTHLKERGLTFYCLVLCYNCGK